MKITRFARDMITKYWSIHSFIYCPTIPNFINSVSVRYYYLLVLIALLNKCGGSIKVRLNTLATAKVWISDTLPVLLGTGDGCR